MIFNWLHSCTSRLPAGVSPSPVSGLWGKPNGTPWPNTVGRDQTGPMDRRPMA